MQPLRSRHLLRVLPFLALAPIASAQWSSNPAANLAAVDRAGEQTQTKLVATADGGFYLAWFDNDSGGSPAFGYDVYLQRYDSAGNEQWAHNGVQVADRGFSSTTDYDLSIDASGNALLAFRDDRPGGVQVTAAKIDATGAPLWGATGVQLTSTTAFVANPKIAGTTDGHAIVAWIQDSTVRLQRLDTNGAATWAMDVVLTPAAGSYSTSDLDASGSGSAILSLVHQTGGFGSPRHLLAQKFDPTGAFQWSASHVAVFDGGSLQLGNFPEMVPDSAGGAVFAWYSASPALESLAQRVDSGGNELFPHDGVSVSTLATQLRVNPAVAFDAATQSTYVFCVELNSMQSQFGVTGQRYDAAGARLWGANGKVLVPLGASETGDVTALVVGTRAVATWTSAPAFGQDVVSGASLDSPGTATSFALATTPSTKFRFSAERSSYGFGVIAWRDERGADPDIYLQDVLPNGTLGGLASSVVRNGTGVNGLFFTPITEPRIGHTWTTEVEHGHHPGALATVVQMRSAPSTGPLFPYGEALVSGGLLAKQIQSATGSVNVHDVGLPASLSLVGATVYTQAAIVGGGPELANAIDITIGL